MPDVRVEVKPNRAARHLLEQGGDRIEEAQRSLIKRVAFDVEAEAKRNSPVITGALRRSIHGNLRQLPALKARVTAQEPYARRVENLPRGGKGSRGRRGPRYMARARDAVAAKLNRFWREELRGFLR